MNVLRTRSSFQYSDVLIYHVTRIQTEQVLIINGQVPHVTGFTRAVLGPGVGIEEHSHQAMDQVFYVTEGTGIVEVDGTVVQVIMFPEVMHSDTCLTDGFKVLQTDTTTVRGVSNRRKFKLERAPAHNPATQTLDYLSAANLTPRVHAVD